jgi:hypothetical protein
VKLHHTPTPNDEEREMTDAQRLADALGRYGDFFDGRMLELGAGQGWASCLIKRLNPRAQIEAA